MSDDNIVRPFEFGISKGQQKPKSDDLWVAEPPVEELFKYLQSEGLEIMVGTARHKDGAIQVYNNCSPLAAYMLLQYALDTLRPAAMGSLMAPEPESEE